MKYSILQIRERGYRYSREINTWIHEGYGKRYKSLQEVKSEIRQHEEQSWKRQQDRLLKKADILWPEK